VQHDKLTLFDIFDPKISGRDRLTLFKKFYLLMALSFSNGNRGKAAEWMGISKNACTSWIKKYTDIEIESPTLEELERYHSLREDAKINHGNCIARQQINKTRRSFWFKQLNHAEQIEVINRLNQVWRGLL
jgi:hypothetical protein